MNFRTIPEMFHGVVMKNPDKKLLFGKKSDSWVGYSGREIMSTVRHISFGLRGLGIGPGGNVAILSGNSPRWAMADYGIVCSGAATVCLYPTLTPAQVAYILRDSLSKAIFVEDEEQLEKVDRIRDDCPDLSSVIVMNDWESDSDGRAMTFSEFCAKGEEFEKTAETTFEKMVGSVKPEDLLTLIYTSGTTGNPKGVMLTHDNLVSNIHGINERFDFDRTGVFLSFLPLSHSLERMGGHFTAFCRECAIYYAEDIESLPGNFLDVKPNVVLSVPRLFEKVYEKVKEQMESLPPWRGKIFGWAIRTGNEVTEYRSRGKPVPALLRLKRALAGRFVCSKVKARLGGEIEFFISGGAPLSREIAAFFGAMDILILEGYGLTETSPVLTVNSLDDYRYGTVGKPLCNVEIRIAADGEILARGPNVMKGYFNNPGATSEALDPDGWLRTGDIGEFDEDGFLKVTDRKKNLIVTSTGNNVTPATLENMLLQSSFIEQTMVIGDNRNYVAALIVPDFKRVSGHLASEGAAAEDPETMIKDERVLRLFDSEVASVMSEAADYERVKRFALLREGFTIERGELTPTMKVVRKKVLSHYSALIETLYSGKRGSPDIAGADRDYPFPCP